MRRDSETLTGRFGANELAIAPRPDIHVRSLRHSHGKLLAIRAEGNGGHLAPDCELT
jgi:hypothetical protein